MNPGLMFEGDSGKQVTLLRLTSLSLRSKEKFKLPYNFEETPYVDPVFLPRVIYENVNILFIEIYRIQYFESGFSGKVINFGLKKL